MATEGDHAAADDHDYSAADDHNDPAPDDDGGSPSGRRGSASRAGHLRASRARARAATAGDLHPGASADSVAGSPTDSPDSEARFQRLECRPPDVGPALTALPGGRARITAIAVVSGTDRARAIPPTADLTISIATASPTRTS